MKAIQKLGGNKSRMWYKFAIPFLCPNSTAFSSLMLAECEVKSWEERIGGGVKRRKGVGGREAFLGSGSDLLFLRPSSSLPFPFYSFLHFFSGIRPCFFAFIVGEKFEETFFECPVPVVPV